MEPLSYPDGVITLSKQMTTRRRSRSNSLPSWVVATQDQRTLRFDRRVSILSYDEEDQDGEKVWGIGVNHRLILDWKRVFMDSSIFVNQVGTLLRGEKIHN